jgi:hypothetical protein
MTKDSPRTSVLRDAPKRVLVGVSHRGCLSIDNKGGKLNGFDCHASYILASHAALSEAPEVQALIDEAVERATRVKPLVWGHEAPYQIARVFGGHYSIESWEGGFDLRGNFINRSYLTLEAAKAAAQADYEARIRAAIGGNDE